jgi:hypothetical protein
MSTVLEEKIPMVQHYLVEQYGHLSQSAVDTVAQGLKSAVSMGIASSAQDSIGLGGPDTSQMLGPLMGTKISEAAGVASPEVAFQGQFKGLEKSQNAELTTFASNVFGQTGALKSLQERGIIIICKPGESSDEKGIIIDYSQAKPGDAKGIWVQTGMQDSLQEKGFIIDGSKTALNQAELQDSQAAKGIIINGGPARPADTKGFVIYGSENPQSAAGIVGPEYTTLNEMEQTLLKTLKLQQELQRFNGSIKA